MLLAEIPSLSWQEALLRVVIAATLGGAVGLERELRDHDAGFRTHMLVAIGSALFTIVSAYAFRDFLTQGGAVVRADPTRIAAQIVTGIGFLGAGAIIRQGLSVRGLTTAATLWVVAAIGMASGAGYYGGAVITTAVVLISLWPLRLFANMLTGRFRPQTNRLLAQLPAGSSPGPLIDEVERLGARVESLEISHEADRRTVVLDVKLPPRVDAPRVIAEVGDVEGVLEVRWTD
ncbi:MAG TPA: MgtC/SapB family protein [Gaiellaceae bacterium]|jgi:putative Mg2+ transporter-C (MgtC) family protein